MKAKIENHFTNRRKGGLGKFIRLRNSDKEYILDHCHSQSDPEISTALGIPETQVKYYRRHVLFIKKEQGRKRDEDQNNSFEQELEALMRFKLTYNGVMLDSLKHRIRILLTTI